MVLASLLAWASSAGSGFSVACSAVSSVVSGSAVASSGSAAFSIGGSSGMMAGAVSSGAGVSAASSCSAFFYALAAAFSARVTFALDSWNVSGSTPDA